MTFRRITTLLLTGLLVAAALLEADLQKYPACSVCGMDRQQHAHGRMLLEYDDKTGAGTCSVRCTAVDMAAYREKTITNMMVADYATGKLISASKAIWVIGGRRPGIMTRRAKWAFSERNAAEAFIKENGGRTASYDDAMRASFTDLAGDVTIPLGPKPPVYTHKDDIQTHSACRYCGMDRKKFDYSRMLVYYKDSDQIGTCSIHCSALALALNYGKTDAWIGVADYSTKKLINARSAYWVIGGDKAGVMSLRGKWAFKMRKDAVEFTRQHGGHVRSFEAAMQAAFEDMWEILK